MTIELDENNIETVKDFCNYVIGRQRAGNAIPGHHPRSGVFADCSMACDPQCYSVRAYRLLKQIEAIEKQQKQAGKAFSLALPQTNA
jgi:hypothetical protein